MLSLDLNMIFWADLHWDKHRERNTKYSFNQLKELASFLSRSFNVNCNLYDYSTTRVFEEAIHIPYPNTAFKKAEKINNILKNTKSDLISIVDSDCFLDKSGYETLEKALLDKASPEVCLTFDFCDLGREDSEDIVNNKKNPGDCQFMRRFPGKDWSAGGLGGFYVLSTQALKRHGGFNEKFIYWGGEDGEAYDKINYDNSVKKIILQLGQVKIYHLWHYARREDPNYYNHDYYLNHQQR